MFDFGESGFDWEIKLQKNFGKFGGHIKEE